MPKKIEMPEEELRGFIESGMTEKEIADHYGCAEITVKKRTMLIIIVAAFVLVAAVIVIAIKGFSPYPGAYAAEKDTPVAKQPEDLGSDREEDEPDLPEY